MRGLHHLHLRKRKAIGFEPFPARTHWMRILDGVVLIVGIVSPFTTIPQIVKIFELQTGVGVSVVTWLAYALFDIPWILYGVVHRSRPITITYALWLVMNLLVAGGAMYYGAGLF